MSALTPEQWHEISPYLDQALSLSKDERAQWLSELRAQRSDTANLVEELLREHDALSDEHFLEGQLHSPGEEASTGEVVGAYKLISRIGEGGMGNVWLAERADGRFERKVALKFLHFSVASPAVAERFKREGRILGQLRHPHIAELIDAGLTPKGEPYLALEYVQGLQIDEYCDKHKLGVRARIELFRDVLSAVAHAHANLIVHRDIKPSNVLVSSEGEVKLLDFGIAKLLSESTSAATATQLTIEGGAAMTPLFAAPEQVTGGAITTATDIYALGALLYLLLTGRYSAGPGPHTPADLVKSITEMDTPLASQGVIGAKDAASSEKRSSTPDKLHRQLRGDLDTILAKTLKKNPIERYASVAALDEDLRRYLHHEPIAARPDTVSYRLRKYVRRHRVGVAVAAALVLLLSGFSAVQAIQLRRITRERDRADRIAEFMKNMFKVSDPSEARGNTVTAREILDKASRDIDSGLANDPELQAQMMSLMGDVYDGLGLYPRAESLLTRAIEIRRGVIGPQHPDSLESRRSLGWVLQEEGRYSEAEKLQRDTLADERRVLGPEHPDTLSTMNQLGGTLLWMGRYVEAEKLHREALDIEQRVLGKRHPRTVSSMHNLASDLFMEGRYAEAEELQREELDIQRRVLGADHPSTLIAMDNLAGTLMEEGRYTDAEKLERETLEKERRVFGPEHPSTVSSLGSLGLILKHEARYEEAEELIRQSRDIDRRVLGPDHRRIGESDYNLGCIEALKGNREQALSLIREAVDHGLFPTFDVAGLEQDEDLKSLHGDPRFAALISYAKKKAASVKSN